MEKRKIKNGKTKKDESILESYATRAFARLIGFGERKQPVITENSDLFELDPLERAVIRALRWLRGSLKTPFGQALAAGLAVALIAKAFGLV